MNRIGLFTLVSLVLPIGEVHSTLNEMRKQSTLIKKSFSCSGRSVQAFQEAFKTGQVFQPNVCMQKLGNLSSFHAPPTDEPNQNSSFESRFVYF